MKQHLKVPYFRFLEQHAEQLRNLRIENMEASRPEDVREILAAIPDVDLFNKHLQSLIFDKLIPSWNNLDAQDQMSIVAKIVRIQDVINSRNSAGILSENQTREEVSVNMAHVDPPPAVT